MKSMIYFISSYILMIIDSIYFSYKLFFRFKDGGNEEYIYFLKAYFFESFGGPLTALWICLLVIGHIQNRIEIVKARKKTRIKTEELIKEFRKNNGVD